MKNFVVRVLQKLARFVNRKVQYPLIMKEWNVGKAPGIIASVLDSKLFTRLLITEEIKEIKAKNILVIAPHQDDEAIGCGGLLLKNKGAVSQTVCFVTDGAQSNIGVTIEESVALREKEAIAALKILKADPLFLRLPNNAKMLTDENAEQLAKVIRSINPDLILTPWIFDKPAKHRMVSLLLYNALKKSGVSENLPVWLYQVHNLFSPNIAIDVTYEMEEKIEAVKKYKSQLEHIAPYDHHIEGLNKWNSQFLKGRTRRAWAEIYFAAPVSWYKEIFETYIIRDKEGYIQ